MFLLSFVIVAFLATSVAMSASKPVPRFKDRSSIPARFAPVNSVPSEANAAAQGAMIKTDNTIALGGKTISNPDTLGFTTYGYQHNCTMGRQVEHRNSDFIHFDWMWQMDNSETNTNRSVYYQAYDLVSCGSGFEFTAGGIDVSQIGRAGYVSLDADPTQNMGIPAGHESDGSSYFPTVYYDFITVGVPFGNFYGDYPTDRFGWYLNPGTGSGTSNESIWPKIDLQYGTEIVLHMVAAESGGQAGDPQTIGYWRRVGGYGTSAPIAVWSGQRVIDTIESINQTVTAQFNGDKVAVVWGASCASYLQNTSNEHSSQYENDVFYAVSTTQGADWVATTTQGGAPSLAYAVEHGTATGGNITQYLESSHYKFYDDLSALITSDNNLHIVWGCRYWPDSATLDRRNSAIFHWSEDNATIRQVVKADWDNGSGACYAHAWGSDVAKMTISECANGNLYVLFTQFGTPDNPCGDVDNVKNVLNGYLYMTASDDGGMNWDRAQRVTNTPTTPTGCIPEDLADTTIHGTCNSEYWASMARFSRNESCSGPNQGLDVLDIVYINDKAPGGCVQTESGVWTVNPVIWWTTPCRDVVYEPLYSDDAGTGYGECFSNKYLWALPNSDTTLTLGMSNPGLLANNYTVTIDYTDGSGWISPSKTSGVLPAQGGVDSIDITFTAPAGAPDPSTWVGAININHQVDGATTRVIPACLVVTASPIIPESAVLATACKRVKVFNQGELVNNESNAAMDYIEDCDTFNVATTAEIYLYDASPIVVRIDGSDTLRFWAYSTPWTDSSGLRPLSSLTVDTTGSSIYSFASSEFATADSTIGFIVEYYVPKAAGDCEYIIKKLKIFNRTASAINNVLVGEFLDWDVPSDTGSNNGSAYDVSRQLIYQFGGEYNQDDSTEGLCPQESSDRFAGIARLGGSFRNATTLDNATYVYSSGPYANTAPMPPQVSYNKMNAMGFSNYTTTKPESTYTDLSTLVTFDKYNLAVNDTSEVCLVLATVKTGLADLQAAVDDAENFVDVNGICELSCCVTAGDANNDGSCNVGDAVFIISYAFRGGAAPVCPAAADANQDCSVNVGDAVFIISYAFRGGPAPNCGCAVK